MGIEIERKFLLKTNLWKKISHRSSKMSQGYLVQGAERSVRVRVDDSGKAFINIKSSTNGISRLEYEYQIPLSDADEILSQVALKPIIEKTRYYVDIDNHTWEIDVFTGANQGLVVAEIELSSEDESFTKPDWVGEEVSGDTRYYNQNLIDHPFCDWGDN